MCNFLPISCEVHWKSGMFHQIAYIFEFIVSMLITSNITQLQDEFHRHLSLPLFRRWSNFSLEELIIYILKLKSWLIDWFRRRAVQFRIVMSTSYDIVLSFTSTTTWISPQLPHFTSTTSPQLPQLTWIQLSLTLSLSLSLCFS